MVSLFKEVGFGIICVVSAFITVVTWLVVMITAPLFLGLAKFTVYSAFQTGWISAETYEAALNELDMSK